MFDIKTLTLGEIAKVEDLSGLSLGVLGEDASPKGKMLAALAFIIHRREEPTFTWYDALGLTMDQANAILGINADEEEAPADPTQSSEATE